MKGWLKLKGQDSPYVMVTTSHDFQQRIRTDLWGVGGVGRISRGTTALTLSGLIYWRLT